MKLSPSFIASSLLCAASASKVGHVYTYDPIINASPQPPSSVTPQTARLILAQRLGLSRFHSITHADDEAVQQINAYGGRPQKLFGGEDRERTKAHVLIWVDDVEDATAIMKDGSTYTAAFTVSDPPSASANERLIEDFTLQAACLPKKADPKLMTYQVGIEVEALMKAVKDVDIYNDYLSMLRVSKADKLDISTLSTSISQLLAKSIADKDQGFPITVVLMPPSSTHSKRSAHPYGAYDLPAPLVARGEPTEAVLSFASEPSTSPATPSDLEDFPTILQANDTSPVLGILPVCFETLDACIRTTKNCSSHGSCKLLHKASGDKDGTKDCFGCACERVVEFLPGKGMEEMKKYTYWGGPACQKRDISVPFFLFASIGILLAGLIAASIGLMFSMGNEELPSVIGAGVSGPQRK